jgi:hypothetical protein
MIHPSQGQDQYQQPPPQGYPPQGYPPQGYPQPGYPPQGYPQPGYPPQGYPPQGYAMPPAPHGGFIPHAQKIMQLEGIFIKQKMDLTEVLTGCETENKYFVYQKKAGEVKKKGKKLYKCKEKSSCYSRNCLANICREFKMKIENLADNEEMTEDCLLIEKPCTCTMYCCNRPFINVNHVEKGHSEFIGKIYFPYNFYDYYFEIFDKDNKKRYTISANCCQCGLLCMGYPCETCETVEFLIYGADSTTVESHLTKKNKNCLKSAISDADNFGLAFTPKMTWEDRSLLLAATLFIDFMLFEEKGGHQDNNGF